MTTIEFSVEVDAPPERVWQVTSNPANLPHWDKHIESVDVPGGGLALGVRYRVKMRFMSLRTTVDAEFLEWEPPWRASIRLSGLLEATVTTTLASLRGTFDEVLRKPVDVESLLSVLDRLMDAPSDRSGAPRCP